MLALLISRFISASQERNQYRITDFITNTKMWINDYLAHFKCVSVTSQNCKEIISLLLFSVIEI
jgi:hypothetical protein